MAWMLLRSPGQESYAQALSRSSSTSTSMCLPPAFSAPGRSTRVPGVARPGRQKGTFSKSKAISSYPGIPDNRRHGPPPPAICSVCTRGTTKGSPYTLGKTR
eukprot:421635-Rhodomonas_salina.1